MEKNVPQGDPLVSIRCLVYNHEPYLRQCLDGFVMQETTFPFEAIVHDDASTDGSAAIIREYAERYPHIIKPIYESENQWGKYTINKTMAAAIHPAAKYIAMCEGDDYWTDPHKLQIQVDFLESHPDYYMTCHAFKFYYEDTKEFKHHDFLDELPLAQFKGRDYCTPSIKDYFYSSWFTQVLSIVRRRTAYIEREKLEKYTAAYDYITCYYMLKAGKCAVFKDVMGVYRKHNGGVYSGRDVLKWIELKMKNKYVLYQLENEPLVLDSIDNHFIDVFIPYLSQRDYSKAWELFLKHIKVVPIGHSLKCVSRLIGMALRSLVGKL